MPAAPRSMLAAEKSTLWPTLNLCMLSSFCSSISAALQRHPPLRHREEPFTLRQLSRRLARAPDRLALLARLLFGGLFVGLPPLHFAKHALALHLLLEGFQRLFDVVVADEDEQEHSPQNDSQNESRVRQRLPVVRAVRSVDHRRRTPSALSVALNATGAADSPRPSCRCGCPSSTSKEIFWPSARLPHAGLLERGRMNEDILASVVRLDEAETLIDVIEFHRARLHRIVPFTGSLHARTALGMARRSQYRVLVRV